MTDFSSVSLETHEIIDFLRRDLRLKAIYHEVIYQKIINQAAQEYSLSISGEEIQRELDRFRYEKRFSHPADLLAWLESELATLSDLEQRIHERLLAQKLAQHLFDSQIKAFFAQHYRDFEQVLLYKITVPYESLAYEIFYQIEEEEISFYEAAHLYNNDEKHRLQCGFEGKQQRRMFDTELAERLFNTTAGQIIGPLASSENSYELFLVDEFISPELTPELYDEILEHLFNEWLENNFHLYVSKLKDSSNDVSQ